MHKIYTLIFSICFVSMLCGQADNLNMELVSNLEYPNLLNDIWGYVAPDGTEYAIVGTRSKTSVVDLSDPSNPVEVAEFLGANSIWRDMKHFGEFVYVTTDVGTDGLLVIDMRGAPNNITGEFWQPEIVINGVSSTLEKCHNIFIDEDGYGYLAGCNLNSGGNLIIDLFTSPGQPQFVSATVARYSHDAMVQNDLLYSSDINNGFFSVINVTDKLEPVTIATANTSFNFTHNAWVSTDNNYLFTTDEKPNAFVDSYDISDLTDIKRLDSFHPGATKGTGVIPHNTHYFNGYLVTSWYTDGVRIIDANKPDNLVEVAYYDTYLSDDIGDGFNGAWGVTPYLPSGLVIASDINTGLYVFEANYVRAAYLEGLVTDSETGLALDDVTIKIEDGQLNSKATDVVGEYKTGTAKAGGYNITFDKVGYNTLTAVAILVNGVVTTLDVELVPLQNLALSGTVRSEDDNFPIENASVLFASEDLEYEVMTNANGEFTIDEILEGEYQIYAGAWGYENILFNSGASISQNGNIDILLGRAYMDDFIVDMGWTTESNAETGAWVREEPIGNVTNSNEFSNPPADIDGDLGNKAYLTGNGEGGVGDFDIDGGTVVLTSPVMDLTTYIEPTISYNLWFYNGGGVPNPNDIAIVRISNGETEVDVEVITSVDSEGAWRPTFTFNVAELIEVTSTMRFSVSASDDDPGHLVEAGLDKFIVGGGLVSTISLVENDILKVIPNPFNNSTHLNFSEELTGTITVTNVLGQFVEQLEITNSSQIEIGSYYSAGAYFISLEDGTNQYKAIRIIKQ